MRKPFLWILAGLVTLAWTISAVTTPPNVDSALARQQQLVSESPYLASAHNDLGNLLLLADRFNEAEEAYRQAIELDPNDPGPRFNLGVLQQQQRQLHAATDTFGALLEIYPRHAWGNYQMGVLASERGQRAAAIDYFARAFAADPSLTFPQYNPHIIDNLYATEGMLKADNYDQPPGSNVPRQYSAPERIAEWMLDPETSQLSDSLPEAMPEQGQGAEPALSSQRSVQNGESRPVEREIPADEAPATRRLTPDDLENSNLGRSTRSGSTPRYSPGTSSRIRGRSIGGSTGSRSVGSSGSPSQVDRQDRADARRSSSSVRSGSTSGSTRVGSSPRPTRRSPTVNSLPPANSGDYRPSTLSTGRLELELLPKETIEERLARLTGPETHGAS